MVNLKLAKYEDYDFYYALKCEKDNVYWSGYSSKPNYEHLKLIFDKWIEEMLEHDKRKVYMINFNDLMSGYVYISPADSNEAEISIGVSDRFSGHGIGTNALIEAIGLMRKQGSRVLNAYVMEDNQRSIHVFKKSGFIEDEDGTVFSHPENRREQVKMLKFTYDLF